jgi:hypothetical protein
LVGIERWRRQDCHRVRSRDHWRGAVRPDPGQRGQSIVMTTKEAAGPVGRALPNRAGAGCRMQKHDTID